MTDAPTRIRQALASGAHHLDLSHLYMDAVPPSIVHLQQLRSLKLDENQLTDLPAGLLRLPQPEVLDLSGNWLTELSDDIGRFTALRELSIAGNRMREVPRTIGACTNLEVLDLHRNEVNALPGELGRLTRLRHLRADNNQLRTLPPELGAPRRAGALRPARSTRCEQDLPGNPSEVGCAHRGAVRGRHPLWLASSGGGPLRRGGDPCVAAAGLTCASPRRRAAPIEGSPRL